MLLSGLLAAACGPERSLFRTSEPPQIATRECDGLRVQLTIERESNDAPMYDVYVTDLSGRLLADVTRVVLAFTAMNKDTSTTTLVTQPAGNGHYIAMKGFTLTSGSWRIEAIVRRARAAEVVCAFSLKL